MEEWIELDVYDGQEAKTIRARKKDVKLFETKTVHGMVDYDEHRVKISGKMYILKESLESALAKVF